MKESNKRGFTLIELLVVVLIIGILAAVAVPKYQRAVEKSRAAEAVNMLSSLEKSISRYRLGNEISFDTVPSVLTDYFLGNQSKFAGALDIDLSNLDCNFDGGSSCASKNFIYTIMRRRTQGKKNYINGKARGNILWILAERYKNGNIDDIYYLNIFIQESGAVNRVCIYDEENNVGRGVCEGLKANGWEIEASV